ncbi:MAG: N-acetylmuramoyl-L-alanine amidase [Candidatus Thiodiazotropha taylori]
MAPVYKMLNLPISYIAIHASLSPNDRVVTAADIHEWHLENDWSGIGYHAVIQRNGKIERGRPHFWKGAHILGHNLHTLGICLIGTDEFTDEQLFSLKELILEWLDLYPLAEVVGHRDLDSNRTCPNFDARHWWQTGEVRP